jgi:hypothetical protein
MPKPPTSLRTLTRFLAVVPLVACTVGASAALTAAPASAATAKTVHWGSTGTLGEAMAAAGTGGTVVVDSGTHSAQWLDEYTTKHADVSGITITGASRSGSVIQGLVLKGIQGVKLSNLTLTNETSAKDSVVRISNGSTDIAMESLTVKPKINSGIDIWAGSQRISLRGSTVDGSGVTGDRATNGTSRAVRINGAPYDLPSWPKDITIEGNDLSHAGSDIIQIAGGKNVTINGNTIHDPQDNADHNDGVQSFGSDNLVITNNTFTAPGPNGPDQAIMIADKAGSATLKVTGTTISGNLIHHWRGSGVIAGGTASTKIVKNTIVDGGDAKKSASSIVSTGSNPGLTVTDNILTRYEQQTPIATRKGNCVAQGATSPDISAPDQGFVDRTSYVLKAGSPCAGLGAPSLTTGSTPSAVVEATPRPVATSGGTWKDVSVSGLKATSEKNGWGPVERNRSNGGKAAGDGQAITVGGQKFTDGLGVNAASEISFALPGTCRTFSAVVGVDDEVGSKGSVVFVVRADGKELRRTSVLTGSSAAQKLSVDLGSARQLTLTVEDAGDGNSGDHADWASAVVNCKA